MESAMTEFVRKAIKESIDLQALTKGKLKKMFLEENGLCELTSNDRKLFSKLVDQTLGEIVQTPTDGEIEVPSDTDSDFSSSISKRGKKRKKLLQSDNEEDDFILRRNSDHCSSGESNSDLKANSGKPNKKPKITRQIFSDNNTDSEDDLIYFCKSKECSPMISPKRGGKPKITRQISSDNNTDSEDDLISFCKFKECSPMISPKRDVEKSKSNINSDSDDEPIATFKTTGSPKNVKNSVSSDSEDEPIATLKTTGSSKNVKNSVSSDSEDEPIATLKTTGSSKDVKKSTVEKFNSVTSDSEDEPVANLKTTGSLNNVKNSVSSDSEDEPSATFKPTGSSKNVKKATVDKHNSESSDSENEPIVALRSSKNTQKSRVGPFDDRNNDDSSSGEKGNAILDKKAKKLSQSKCSSESDDEPLALKSKMDTNDGEISDSEDEPIAAVGSKNDQKSKVESFNNGRNIKHSSEEKVNAVSIKKATKKKPQFKSSSESDDEPLVLKSKMATNEGEISDSEDEPIAAVGSSKKAKKPRVEPFNNGRNGDCLSAEKENAVSIKKATKKKPQFKSSSESDDESLAVKSKMDTNDGRNIKHSSEEKENAVSIKKATKKKPQFKSSLESDDEPLALKSKMDTNDGEISDSEDEPIAAVGSSKNAKNSRAEPFNNGRNGDRPSEEKENAVLDKKAKKKKLLQSKCNSESDNEPLSLKSNKKSAKSASSNSAEAKIEKLKKYVRAAGLHIPNYAKLFAGCKTMKAKAETLTDMLHKEGMKGRPTLEKCKKLKKRIETKKEVASLDLTNIIATDSGRPKRNARSLYSVSKRTDDDTSAIDSFSQLKDVIDCEESD